jgi:hypothetical protein
MHFYKYNTYLSAKLLVNNVLYYAFNLDKLLEL